MKAAFKGAAVASAVAALFATAQAQTSNKTQPTEKKDKAGKMVKQVVWPLAAKSADLKYPMR